ncbi:MAG: carbohydrate kinase, partial [Clostridia bacterium]|nr:carbohydrate kinase [Clostridia bacterium]
NAYIGGAPFNVAAHAAKHGDTVYMLSAVGDDELGDKTRAIVRDRGVHIDRITVHGDRQTGVCRVTLNEAGIPSYDLLDNVAWDAIDTADCPFDVDVIYFGTLALRHEDNRRTLAQLLDGRDCREVFVDVNIRPPFYSKDSILFALSHATLLKISDEELSVILDALDYQGDRDHESICRALAARFPSLRVILITKGGDGADAFCVTDERFFSVPAEKTTVVSTVGAGDSFSAAFLHHYLRGEALDDCLRHASKLAAFVVSQYESIPDYTV